MSYCTNCGNQISETSKFCTNCGNKNVESNELEKPIKKDETPLEIKKKGISIWTKFLFIGLFILGLYLIDLYKGEGYPSNEKEFTELYVGKFWKIDDAKLIEMSVGGIPMEENDIIKKVTNDLIENHGFTICNYDTNSDSYWEYYQSFDPELNEETYSVIFYDIEFDENEKKFNLKQLGNEDITYFVKNGELNKTTSFKSSNSFIKSISFDKVVLVITFEFVDEDSGILNKAVMELTYKPTQPSNLNRYNEVVKDPSTYLSVFNYLDEDDI